MAERAREKCTRSYRAVAQWRSTPARVGLEQRRRRVFQVSLFSDEVGMSSPGTASNHPLCFTRPAAGAAPRCYIISRVSKAVTIFGGRRLNTDGSSARPTHSDSAAKIVQVKQRLWCLAFVTRVRGSCSQRGRTRPCEVARCGAFSVWGSDGEGLLTLMTFFPFPTRSRGCLCTCVCHMHRILGCISALHVL